MMTKSFRLFVSSTFTDFIEERNLLQNVVFPKIEQYCFEKGYTFQSIDLRWGIIEEAQLDNKTIDICREAIRICKRYPHPNFLILIGENYGWVPLPFRIEQLEFEKIVHVASESERNELLKWYKLDNNHLPPSYIICERTSPYDLQKKWENQESTMRTMFQSLIQKTDIQSSEKDKYFQSATEQEAIEGISSFSPKSLIGHINDDVVLTISNSQQENVIAFLMEPDDKTKLLNDNVTNFRGNLINAIQPNNIFFIKKNNNYLKNIESNFLKHIKEKIDLEISSCIELNLIEKERQLHEEFRQQKIKHFTGREESLKQIQHYLNLKTEAEPLIIYSESGMGKSALIAKSIETINIRTIFRFVGISPNSSNSQQLLASIIKELDTKAKEPDEIDTSNLFAMQKGNAMVNFSYQVFPILYGGIDKPVVIFIDGLDQLENYDEILWLPKKLPPHVKIILTTLFDKNYPQASQYFETLRRKKFTNLLYLPNYKKEEAQIMLSRICAGYDRTLQTWQSDFILSKFTETHSPLYLKIAAELAKNWKSTADPMQCLLEDDIKSLIHQYFMGLHKNHHHHRELVQRVSSYIVASVDGLSENELLEILATDEAFLDEVAPNTFHNRNFQKLPYSIWMRLFMQLSPFLSLRRIDGHNLYHFFHREFDIAIRDIYDENIMARELIKMTQKVLQKQDSQSFHRTRYGKLYLKVIIHYKVKFPEEIDFFKESAVFPANLDNDWQDSYVAYGNNLQLKLSFENRGGLAIACGEAIHFFMEERSILDPEWGQNHYFPLLGNLANEYRANNQVDKAIEFDEQKLKIAKTLFEQDKIAYLEVYITSLQSLASSYLENNRTYEALKLDEESLNTLRPFYQAEPKRWERLYTMSITSLAISYKSQNRLPEAIKIEEEALLLQKKRFDRSQYPDSDYINTLENLAQSYRSMGRMEEAIRYDEEVVKIIRDQHIVNPEPWADRYAKSLNQLSVSYNIQHRTQEAIELGEQALNIIKPLFGKEPMRFVSRYIANLINLGMIYHTARKLAKAIAINETALQITATEYRRNPDQWANEYTLTLNNLLACYINTDNQKALDHGENALLILNSLFELDPNRWVFEYVRIMLNVGYVYKLENLTGKSITILHQALEILDPLYQHNPLQWVQLLSGCLLNLSVSYFEQGDVEDAINYGQHALNILEPHYRQNPQRWSDTYDQIYGNLTEFKKARNRPAFINPALLEKPNFNRIPSAQNILKKNGHVQHFQDAKKYLEKKLQDSALKEYEGFIAAFENLNQQKQQDNLDMYAEALLDMGIIYHHRNNVGNIPAYESLSEAYNLLCELFIKDAIPSLLLWKATYYYIAELAKSLPMSFFGWRNPKNKVIVDIIEIYNNSNKLYFSMRRPSAVEEWEQKTTTLLIDKKLIK